MRFFIVSSTFTAAHLRRENAEKLPVGCQQFQIVSQARRTQPETHWQRVAAASVPQTELRCHNVKLDQPTFPHIIVQIWASGRIFASQL